MLVKKLLLAAVAVLVIAAPATAHDKYGKVEIDTSCGAVTFDFALKDADEVGWQVRLDGKVVTEGHHAAPDGLYTVTVELPIILGTTVYELRFDDEPVDASYQSETFEVECTEDDNPTPTPQVTPSPIPTPVATPTPATPRPGSSQTPSAGPTLPATDAAPTTTEYREFPLALVFGGLFLIVLVLLSLTTKRE